MPYHQVEKRLSAILDSGQGDALGESRVGIEKESLRVAPTGGLSQQPHPETLGSALTNPFITTDFSEALTEMITPPCASAAEALEFLFDIQKFVYDRIKDEMLWATSMPCVLEGGSQIPLAQYGPSNRGVMKTVYRRGLGYRYGRSMQVIAGVHFNYSFSDRFWDLFQKLEKNSAERQEFVAERYMGIIRNCLRYGWLIPYLFGASPAVCKSFIQGKSTMLSVFNESTAYEPYATSLRMGDIGYTNNKESMAGIKANYDSLEKYIDSLRCAINTPFDEYEAIGVKVDGEYRQLNANILQIENEYYSTVRPKQLTRPDEMPIRALSQRGIQYVEIRSLDVNAFDPIGINEEQLNFLELFIVFCLLQESPVFIMNEMIEIDMNILQVAHFGRQPYLRILQHDEAVELKAWAVELLEAMEPIAQALDTIRSCDKYVSSLDAQKHKALDSAATPSAIMLREMREHDEGFFHFAERMSVKHRDYFRTSRISPEREAMLKASVSESLRQQLEIEQTDKIEFDDFLAQYFSQ